MSRQKESAPLLINGFATIIEVPGATEASIVVPAANEVGEATYKVEVTDSLGSVLSPPATVRFLILTKPWTIRIWYLMSRIACQEVTQKWRS